MTWLTKTDHELLDAWKLANEEKRLATVRELELRNMVINRFSNEENEMAKGTENIDLGFDRWELKINHKLSYKLGDNDAVNMALTKIATEIDGGNFLAERLVKWKPEISVSEYDKLPGSARTVINKVLTISPSQKAVDIKQRAR